MCVIGHIVDAAAAAAAVVVVVCYDPKYLIQCTKVPSYNIIDATPKTIPPAVTARCSHEDCMTMPSTEIVSLAFIRFTNASVSPKTLLFADKHLFVASASANVQMCAQGMRITFHHSAPRASCVCMLMQRIFSSGHYIFIASTMHTRVCVCEIVREKVPMGIRGFREGGDEKIGIGFFLRT